jgi:hypothetical protein
MKDLIVLPGPEKRLLVAEEPALVEENFEPRLQRLGRLVKDLAGSAYPLLVTGTARIRQGLGELVIKEEATRWILRIAKEADEPVRARLLEHVEDALNHLERMAETLLYAECT